MKYLIQSRTWDGPSSAEIARMAARGQRIDSTERIEAIATEFEPNSALRMLAACEDAFRAKYPTRAVNFNVIGIQKLEYPLTAAALMAGRIQLLEDMCRRYGIGEKYGLGGELSTQEPQ